MIFYNAVLIGSRVEVNDEILLWLQVKVIVYLRNTVLKIKANRGRAPVWTDARAKQMDRTRGKGANSRSRVQKRSGGGIVVAKC